MCDGLWSQFLSSAALLIRPPPRLLLNVEEGSLLIDVGEETKGKLRKSAASYFIQEAQNTHTHTHMNSVYSKPTCM